MLQWWMHYFSSLILPSECPVDDTMSGKEYRKNCTAHVSNSVIRAHPWFSILWKMRGCDCVRDTSGRRKWSIPGALSFTSTSRWSWPNRGRKKIRKLWSPYLHSISNSYWQINVYSKSAPQDMFDFTIWMLKIDQVNAHFKQLIVHAS